MIKTKTFFRSGLIFVTILSVVLCSFLTSMVSHSTSQATPFQTVPPVKATFATPIGAQTPVPTPMPTLGPGQYFEEGDDLPDVTRPDLLAEPYGYSEIVGNLDQFLVWSTDDDGNKRYYIVNEGNRYLEKIQEVVDEERRRKRELEDKNAWGKFILNSIATAGFAYITTLCGAGTIASLFAEPISAPITGAGVACTGGGVKFTKDTFDGAVENWSQISGYEKYKEEAARDIEGYFIQIPYSIQD